MSAKFRVLVVATNRSCVRLIEAPRRDNEGGRAVHLPGKEAITVNRIDDVEDRSLWRGVLAGVVGGLVGSVVLKALIVGIRKQRTGFGGTELDQSGPAHQVAEIAVRRATGRPLSQPGRMIAGEVVHYAFGAVVGGFYGGLGESWNWVRLGSGMLFGLGVFAGADELSMPALGLVKKPTDEALEAQIEHLLVHVGFGVSTELVRRAVRRVI